LSGEGAIDRRRASDYERTLARATRRAGFPPAPPAADRHYVAFDRRTWMSLKQPVLPARTALMARLGRHSRTGARAAGDFVLARAAGSTGRPATLLGLTIAPPAVTKIDPPSDRRAIGDYRRVTDRSRARPAAGPRLGQAAAAKAATALAASGFSSSTRWPAPLKISTFAFGSAFFQSSACWGGTSLSSSPHTMRVGTSMRWR
jgi:hypothetical protein